MRAAQMSLLTESIYDAAVDPEGWAPVMQLFKQNFATGAETFYFLDYANRAMRPVHVTGIGTSYVRCFKEIFYTPDNPCTQAEPLHRPGVVRTDERLTAFFRDPQILRRSQYYNEWMRPQDLDHTIGTTLSAEAGTVLNFSLLRSRDRGPFASGEVASFAAASRHLQRALRVAMRLETITTRRSMTYEALEHLRYGVVFVDLAGRLLHCNSQAETLIRRGRGLSLKDGTLIAAELSEQRKLTALLQHAARASGPANAAGPQSVAIYHQHDARPLQVSAIRLSAYRRAFARPQPVILLLITDPANRTLGGIGHVRQLYRLTPAEARLADALVSGVNLKQAANAACMTYETARWYLKVLFQKTGTRRQAELVARLMGDLAAPMLAGGDGVP